MANDNPVKREFFNGLLRDQLQLMLSHFLMRFVFDTVDLPAVLGAANNSPKIDYRSNRKARPERTRWIEILRWCFQPRFR